MPMPFADILESDREEIIEIWKAGGEDNSAPGQLVHQWLQPHGIRTPASLQDHRLPR